MTTLRFAVRSLSCIALTIVVAACSSAPPPAAPPRPVSHPPVAAAPAPSGSAEMATVYIYRPKSFFGMALHPTVMLDGKDLINIGNGRVFRGEFEPAKRAFGMDDGESGAEIDLKAGETYYMKVVIVAGFWKGGGRLSLMAAEQGSFEVKELKPIEQTEIEDPGFRKAR